MKKYLFLIIALITSLMATSCQDEDFGFTIDEIKYTTAFEKAFGKIPEYQNWDFYQQANRTGNGLTRAGSGGGITTVYGNSTLDQDIVTNALSIIPENRYNGTKGQQATEFTYQDEFTLYPLTYHGGYETADYHFVFGIRTKDSNNNVLETQAIFAAGSSNANQSCKVTLSEGSIFDFYITYDLCKTCGGDGKGILGLGKCRACNGAGASTNSQNNDHYTFYSSEDHCRTIYNQSGSNDKIMVLAFEDQQSLEKKYGAISEWGFWGFLNIAGKWVATEPNFHDFVIAIDGNLPVPSGKRFMCEDLIGNYQSDSYIDYNDLVFDLQPKRDRTTDVIIRAVGGTLPIYLKVDGKEVGGELHSLLGKETNQPINVGAMETKTQDGNTVEFECIADAKIINIPLDLVSSSDALEEFNNVEVTVLVNGDEKTISFPAEQRKASPYIIATPIETNWMKENICIKRGYPDFFTGEWWKNMVSSNVVD